MSPDCNKDSTDPLIDRLDAACAMADQMVSRLDAIERKDAAERVTARVDAALSPKQAAWLAEQIVKATAEYEKKTMNRMSPEVLRGLTEGLQRAAASMKDSDIDNNSFSPDSAKK